jgi:hypothetical protein
MKSGFFLLMTVLSLPLAGFSSPALACAEARPSPGIAEKGVLYDTPIYDPGSKRYFALMWARNPQDIYRGANWAKANTDAKARQFKGVQGRLAVIDTPEVHSFLMQTFHPPCEAWIGVRYWCGPRQLEWTTGQYWKPGSFQAWDRAWKQDEYSCKPGDKPEYMPVAYSATANGFRWIGKGPGKEYFAYFIEYPTGKP